MVRIQKKKKKKKKKKSKISVFQQITREKNFGCFAVQFLTKLDNPSNLRTQCSFD